MNKFIFLTSCSDTKNEESYGKMTKLKDMYNGLIYNLRIELVKCFTDDFYITSLLGVGIVREDFECVGYNAPPSTRLKQYSKDPNFCKRLREEFDARYPHALDGVDRIYFLGNAHHNDCIKSIFYDKEVIICINQKLRAGAFRSILTKTIRTIKGINEEFTSEYFEYKGWLFEYRKSGKEKSHHLYEKVNDKYIEINPFDKKTNFINKFRELTGNLTTKEYIHAVNPESEFFELMTSTIKSYFIKILNIIPIKHINSDRFAYINFVNKLIFFLPVV